MTFILVLILPVFLVIQVLGTRTLINNFFRKESFCMTDAVSSVMGIVSSLMTTIQGNDVLMAFMCAGLIGIAVGVIKKLVGRY